MTAKLGRTPDGCKTPEYLAWVNMRTRRKDGPEFTVCTRWNSFADFLADMGERPSPLHHLERLDRSKGFSPDNCRWMTYEDRKRFLYGRIMKRVRVDEQTGCWQWEGYRHRGAYARFSIDRGPDGNVVTVLVHRWLYEHLKGPIPAGLELDHLCRNQGCVNPEHLEPTTRSVNLRRIYDARTQCSNGHDLSVAGWYVAPSGKRRCRACIRAYYRRWYARQSHKR